MKGKEIVGSLRKAQASVRLPGADEPKNAFQVFKQQFENFTNLDKLKQVPKHTDVLVVGGGLIGSFVAYWLRTTMPSLSVTVVERDSSYVKAGTFWSVGGFRQQFSLPENIKMSMFGVEFLKEISENLKCGDNDEVDVPIYHDGYLFCGNETNSDLLYNNHKIQLSQKAQVQLLDKEEIRSKFKWINGDDLKLASFGYNNEGWLDSRKFLLAVRKKALHIGADYVEGEVTAFETKSQNEGVINSSLSYDTALVDTFDGNLHPVKFQTVVNAAGPYAAQLARLMGIGTSEDFSSPLSVGLPVEPRKRYVFQFYAEDGPMLNVPLTIDASGVWFRRSKKPNTYLCGLNNSAENEPSDLNLRNIDHDYFERHIKPVLLHRVPSFANLKVVSAWAGPYEYNSLDQNLIIGRHPVFHNMIFANGSSGHGLQHACAIGKAVQELVTHNAYTTVDLKRFGFERVLKDQPLKEIEVV